MARENTSHAVPGFPPLPERNRVFPLRAPQETEARLRYKTLQLMSRRHNRTVIARHEAMTVPSACKHPDKIRVAP